MRTTSRPHRTGPYAVALLALGVTLLPACSQDPTPKPKEPTAAERLAAARRTLDGTSSVHLRITSPDFPAKAEGVTEADGVATHQPAYKGTLTVRARGLSGKVDVVSVGGTLHLRLPFTRSFVQADPKDYNAPDPASLLSPQTGISSLLTATQDARLGEKKRDGTAVVQTVTGTLPGQKVVDLLATGNGSKAFAVTYTLTDKDQLRSARITGPFFAYAAPQTTYDVGLDGYGQAVTVEAP